jgi:hypothetical protein
VPQIEYGEVTSVDVIARSIEALSGRLDLVPISATGPSGCPSATMRPPREGNQGTCRRSPAGCSTYAESSGARFSIWADFVGTLLFAG